MSRGYPSHRLGGVLRTRQRGYPSPGWREVTPVLVDWTSVLPRRSTQSWLGVPQSWVPTPEGIWDQSLGHPQDQSLGSPRRDMGPVVGSIVEMGYPSPPLGCVLVNKLKLLPSPILHMRAVRIDILEVVMTGAMNLAL